MRIVVALIAFIIWCFVSWNWYVCKIKGLCSNEIPTSSISDNKNESDMQIEKGNLVFNWSDETPITDANTQITIDSLKNIIANKYQLEIIGLYRPDEMNNSSFENLGLARAQSVKDYINTIGGLGTIAIDSREVDGTEADGLFKGANFNFIELPVNDIKDIGDGGFEFTESAGKIIINFPVASADPGLNQALMDELKKIAKHAVENDQSLDVVGHTDNTGTHETNVKYGQLRADVIAKMLLEYGVPDSKVTASSEGEHQPIANNTTEEGKKQNRRVEILIQ